MKKLFFLSLAALMIAACSDKKTEPSDEPIDPQPGDDEPAQVDKEFVRKHLIEEFTGQGCGHCPLGMNYVSEFIGDDTTFVTVLHHTYGTDDFTVAGSQTIAGSYGIQSAPNVMVDRLKFNADPEAGESYYYHPGYLENLPQLADKTYASIRLYNTYSDGSGDLMVHIEGQIFAEPMPEIKLTVLVKESGMIATQEDFWFTFNNSGWTKFRHVNAVRAFLTEPLGNLIEVAENGFYALDLSTALAADWIPDNCSVVAFLTLPSNEVIQVEQAPVVAGTKGGQDIKHEGIEAAQLMPEFYPEPEDGTGPMEVMNVQTISIEEALSAQYNLVNYNGTVIAFWSITGAQKTPIYMYSGSRTIPYVDFQLLLPSNTTSLPTGTFEVSIEPAFNTLYGGSRSDIGEYWGSVFQLINSAAYKNNTVAPKVTWLLRDGSLTINEDYSWSFSGHTLAGQQVTIQGNSIVDNGLAQQQ
ncbi:MAG: Omp28-related outer membrane protein [Paludibacteraceae bacterium]|nr:Omp28-related outer membrane protein [Paludibacteraceae bacterium]